MDRLNDKTKKWLVISMSGIICVVLIISIASRFRNHTPVDSMVSQASTTENKVSSNSEIITVVTTEDNSITDKPVESTTRTEETNASSSTGTEQAIQTEPTKPAAPTSTPKPQGDITDPKSTPAYDSKDTVVTESKKPKAGDKNDKGQVWFPGFGWVDDKGNNKSIKVDGEGDIDKQVGSMD
jgi:hypothetical protein